MRNTVTPLALELADGPPAERLILNGRSSFRSANFRMRFECQPGCTACCEQQGFVYLTAHDAIRIAGFLEMAPDEFERRYIYRTRNLRRLKVPRHSQCYFLRDGRCSIHAVKHVQCRAFPYWPELVDDRKEWYKMAAYCPGIGKGDLIQIEIAQEQAQEMRDAYPSMYP
jgi:uncharacterized protein